MKENARVTLPKPAKEIHVAAIEIRRRNIKKTVEEYKERECNGTGNQKPNLTKNEKAGLISLQKRIKAGEIIIMQTYKSSKLAKQMWQHILSWAKSTSPKIKK